MPRTTAVEAPGCPAPVRAICGDELGVVKVVEARERGQLSLVSKWGDGEPSRVKEILAIALAGDTLAAARKSGMVDLFDVSDGKSRGQLAVPKTDSNDNRQGRDRICGLHLFTGQDNLLSCKEDGSATLQDIQASIVSRWSFCSPAGKILTMKVHGSEKFVAVGGDGVELNLWNLEKKCKHWEAKKPKPDKLGLTPPALVTSSAFLSNDDHRKIVIGTGNSTIRLYDVVAQRREVLSIKYDETPIKAVAEDPDGFTVYIGNAVGNLASFDIRMGRQTGVFKGKMTGSVRCITRHPTLPLVASCGLDRFLRVHDIKSRQLLIRIFLKVPLSGVVFDERTSLEAGAQQDDQMENKENEVEPGPAGGLSDEDELVDEEEEAPSKKTEKKRKKASKMRRRKNKTRVESEG